LPEQSKQLLCLGKKGIAAEEAMVLYIVDKLGPRGITLWFFICKKGY
jgi:hypothetical protein